MALAGASSSSPDSSGSSGNGNGNGGGDASLSSTADDLYFDDEGLGTLERIWLFARSRASSHRYVSIEQVPN